MMELQCGISYFFILLIPEETDVEHRTNNVLII